ncbi:MAG: hypothetical protein LUH54_04915, partial [Firmicutes bacterium]|nr:hypothetical protein [Bacillota bacterium]
LIQLAYALPNSFILTMDDMVTLSPLSPATLALRCRGGFEEGFDFRRKQICGDAGEDLPDEFEEDEETEEEENL